MKALLFERRPARFAAATVAGAVTPGGGARVGPLRLTDIDAPPLPGPGWQRVRPRLAGICGSDLATIDGHASRWFEPVVSFPFVPGHEVVGDLDDGTRVVIKAVLACAARGIDPPCRACAAGHTGNCERITFGAIEPGLQTGFCRDTSGGWAVGMIAHESQLHPVPDELSDDAAVMIEPAACAVHAVRSAEIEDGDAVAVVGAGTLGLCTVAALRRHASPGTVVVAARYPEQRRLARQLGGDVIADPGELRRAVRRVTGSLAIGDGDIDRLTAGADVVFDCAGTADSLEEALAVARPRGRVVLVGMAGVVSVDLTPLWQREIALVGAYTYDDESFAGAAVLAGAAQLERLVSARYPLDRYADAIAHAASAGRRGAVKIVFDMRNERERERL